MGRLGVKLKLDTLRSEIELARKMANRSGDPHAKQHAAEASELVAQAEKRESLDAEALQSLIHQVHSSLNHEHPEMRKYTGHLVGHAHIDFQWLWEWPETVQVCHDTFSQAVKFMDEFKAAGFTFSQSSAALYAAVEGASSRAVQKDAGEGRGRAVGNRRRARLRGR
jgi:alpha-mannosidase